MPVSVLTHTFPLALAAAISDSEAPFAAAVFEDCDVALRELDVPLAAGEALADPAWVAPGACDVDSTIIMQQIAAHATIFVFNLFIERFPSSGKCAESNVYHRW